MFLRFGNYDSQDQVSRVSARLLLAMAAAIVPYDQDGADDAEPETLVKLPEKGVLAKRWEQRALIRESVRSNKKLLLWPSQLTTGVASQAALKINRMAIADLISEWGAVCTEPRAPPVQWLREEAQLLIVKWAEKVGRRKLGYRK